MRTFFSRMNPTLRGFLIILAIVLIVVVLQLQASLDNQRALIRAVIDSAVVAPGRAPDRITVTARGD